MILGGLFDLDNKCLELVELEKEINDVNFWFDNTRASQIMVKANKLKELINKREFCESIYIKGASESDKNENLEELLKWVRKKDENSFTIRYIPYFFIAITTIMIILIITN